MIDSEAAQSGSETDQRLYTPAPGEAQLTARAVIVGCLVGSVVSCTNIYIGLKIGWSFGASIISAVLGFSAFAAFGKRLSVLETNSAQTAGSAAGYMSSAAGLLAAIPAMNLLGFEISWPMLILWSLGVAFLGVFYAVPLRRQFVEIDKLRFPTGTATAQTIMAMFSEAAEAMSKARVLLLTGVAAGLFTLASHFVPVLESLPLHQWFSVPLLSILATWSFKVYLGPSLFGAGFLIGPRVVLSLVLGAIIAWGVLVPRRCRTTRSRRSSWRRWLASLFHVYGPLNRSSPMFPAHWQWESRSSSRLTTLWSCSMVWSPGGFGNKYPLSQQTSLRSPWRRV